MKVGGHDIRYVREADRNTIRCSFKRYDEQSGALRTFLLVNYFRHHARFFLAIFSSFAVRHVLLLNRESHRLNPSMSCSLNRLNLDFHVRLVIDLQNGNVQGPLDEFGSQRVAAIRFPVSFGPKSINERLRFLSPIYKLIRYHRLIFDSVADGVFRSTYMPWIDSITFIKAGEKEEIELRLNSSYENVWRVLKERLDVWTNPPCG
jgi:hypothetical protein